MPASFPVRMKAYRATYALLHEKTISAPSKQRPSWPSDTFGIHDTTRTLDNNGSVTPDYRLSQNRAVDRLHENFRNAMPVSWSSTR